MSVPALYLIVVVVWGSTWYAIKLQLGPVAEELSVAYRFALAAACLFLAARLWGRPVALRRDDYPWVILQGVLMYSIAYVLVYVASRYITTGLIALLYSAIVILNGLLERGFYGTVFDRRLFIAAATGLAGTALVFWPEITVLSLDDSVLRGVLWAAASVLFAALGNMAAIRNTRRGIPVIAINAHGMAWGALLSFVIALVLGRPLAFSFDPVYLGSLLWLAVAGSCIAFGAFIALLTRIGAGRASYVSVLFPLIALLISTIFENYRWNVSALAGVILILAGNWLALSRVPAVPAKL